MDPIANMLIMIKNASNAEHAFVSFPFSKIKFAIALVLEKEGYISSVAKKMKKGFPIIEVGIAIINDGTPRIHNIERVSKPSLRVYTGSKEIKSHKQGHGITVLSTPKGIMTNREARKELVGGEVLFKIW